jgi:membrane protease YdiL (CAAX protease family)
MPSEQRMRREVSELCLIFVLYVAVIELIDRFSIFVSGEVDFNNLFGLSGTAFNRMEMVRYLGTYILMFAVPLSVYFIVKSKEKTTDYFLVNRAPKMGATLLGCVGILAINYVFTIISDAGVMIFPRLGVLADVPGLMAIGDDPVCNVLYFFILVVAPAILEEFCFRGVICGRLAGYNRTAAVLISSILFSLSRYK